MKSYDAWSVKPLISSDIPIEDFLRHLVSWAILAPNSHNSQPWRFVINPKERCVHICLDQSRVLPASDTKGREAHISLGCAGAYLYTAALAYGYYGDLKYLPPNAPQDALMTMRIPELTWLPRNNDLLNAMSARKSNRGIYNSQKSIPEVLVGQFSKFAKDADVGFTPIFGKITRRILANMLYAAERVVTSNDSFRRELGDYFLDNDNESHVGMPGHTFGLADKDAGRMAIELKKDAKFPKELSKNLATSSYNGFMSAPLIGVISAPEDTPLYWLKTGFAFGRMAIAAEINGLATAIHAAFVEAPPFNFALKMRLMSLWRPTVVFRVGYATEERQHSPRINASEITTVI